MRSGPNTRRPMRRGNSGGGRRGGSPRSQNFDSNGPDIKVRGNAQQVVDKYQTLAREAATAGDPVMAENYYQHAEHYYRVLHANDGAEQRQGGRPHEGDRNQEGARSKDESGSGDVQPAAGNGSDGTAVEAAAPDEQSAENHQERQQGRKKPQAEPREDEAEPVAAAPAASPVEETGEPVS